MMLVQDFNVTVYNPKTKLHEEAKISVVVDVASIARQLGSKAFRSKAGRSVALSGAIIVTHGPQK